MPRKAQNPRTPFDSQPSDRTDTRPATLSSPLEQDQPVNKPAQTRNTRKKPRRGPPVRDSLKPRGGLGGEPTKFRQETADLICATMAAEGLSLNQTMAKLDLPRKTVFRWLLAQPQFREDLNRARDIRGDFTFGEQIIDIADDATNDFMTAQNGRQIVNKEIVLRSKIRIETRQYHMSRLHPQQWGERQTIDIKNDWSLLSDEERRRKAEELIAMIRELKEPPLQPPPLIYRGAEPAEDDDKPKGIG